MALRTALFFEELEHRLLFSADLAGVDAEVQEQDYAEEPVIASDLESDAESDDTALQAEDQESAGSTEPAESADGMESEASDAGAPASEPAGGEETAVPQLVEAESENIAPVLTQPDGPIEYVGGQQPVLVAPAATVVDADSADFKQGTLSVSISAGGSADDDLSISTGGEVSLLNNNIKVEQKLVGSFAGGTDGTALVISWSPQATPDYAEAVLRQIVYGNDSPESAGSRTIDFVLTDGDGGVSNIVQSVINLAGGVGAPGDDPGQGEGDGGEEAPGENMAPVLAQPDGPFAYTGGDQELLIASAATVVDLDSADFKQGMLSVSFSQGDGGEDQLLIVPGGDVSLLNNNIRVEQKLVGSFAGGTDGAALVISWSPQATPDYAEAVLRQIAYCNGSAEPTPGSRTIDFVLTDGDGGVSNTVTSIINVSADGLPGSGSGPGDGDGNDDGDTGGGEVVAPIDEPVDEQDDTPEQKVPGGEEEIPKGSQEESSGSGGSEGMTPPVAPVIEPEGSEKMVIAAPDGSSIDYQPATGEWPDEATSAGEIREQEDPARNDSLAAQETENFFAPGNQSVPDVSAPSPEGWVGYENEAGGYAFDLPLEPAVAAGQGQDEVGDVSPEEKSNSATMRTTIGRLLDFFSPTAAAAAPVFPTPNPDSDGEMPAENEKVWLEVESMRREMEEAFLQSTKADRLMVYTTTGASLSLTAGIARYFFQSGSLLSGFLATVPLWKGFDPVAVLSTPKIERKKEGAISPSTGIETVDQKAETMFAVQGEA